MLKSKLKTILIIALLFIFIITPFVHADNEDIENINDDSVIIDEGEMENEENYKNSDVYLTGNDVTIDYTVVGNAFIIANNVTISAPIGGDAFVLAKNVTIDNNGYVYSNLFVSCDKLNINGIVYDLYATCNNITIGEKGYIYRDIRTMSSSIDILGTIGRNAYVGCDKISLSSQEANVENNSEESKTLVGTIYGNLEYSSKNEIEVPANSVKGDVKFTSFNTEKGGNVLNIIFAIISSILFTVIIWLILNWLAPNYIEKSKELLTSKIGSIIGFGLLGLIVLPIISLILLLIPITTSLALLILGIYIILIALSTAIFVITTSELIADKFNLTNKWLHLAIIAAGAFVIYLLKLIPYVSGIISIICIVLGLGILIKKALPSRQV